jgi:hypothetical protein
VTLDRSGKPEREAFLKNYMAARDVQQHLYVDRALSVAEGRESPGLNPDDFDNPREYRPKVNENVQRDRLIVDTLRWTAERLLPKVYGRHSKLEHDVGPQGPIVIRWRGSEDDRERPSRVVDLFLGPKPRDEESAP